MSRPMSDTDIKDLSAYEFAIPCEWPDCDEPAVVMGKGCIDTHHIAVCEGHHRWIRGVFDTIPPFVICAACDVPMLVFDHHFDIQYLR